MKLIYHVFLYLNIYTAIACGLHAQKISLIIEAEKQIPSESLITLSPATSFSTYLELEAETSRILSAFQKEGFIDCRLLSMSEIATKENAEEEISYKASYFLGPKFLAITIFFDPENFSRKEISRFTQELNSDSFSIPISEVENTLLKLNSLQTEKGDAFAKIYLSEFKKNGNKLSAQLISEATKIRKIDSIIIIGYEKFPLSYIKYLAGLKKGTLFSTSKIEKSSTAIDALPFASSIKPPEVLFKDQQTSLYLYLEKIKSNNFDGIIGFSTDEATNKLVFNGYLDLQLNNNLNFGETFILNYKSDGNDQQNFNVQTTLPYLFKSPLGVDLGLTIFRQAENFSTTSQLAGLRYQLNPNAIATLSYTGSNSSILGDEDLITYGLLDFKKNELTIGSQWKFYQSDILFPIKATFGLNLGAGTKNTATTKEQQYRFAANVSYILELNDQNSLYVANSTGLLSSDTFAVNELYRIGGINSIRGFKENSIETNLFSLLNTEYRYRLNRLLYVHSIIDIGYLENQITNNNSSLYSFGLGTGFYTKTGLLKLSFANGKTQDQDFKFSDLKIHLSLITTF